MDKVWITILVLSGLYFAFLTGEAIRARQDRKKLQHVIYVNGTRGKSTVSRLIAAGLAAGGYRVMCKTTGTLPLCLHPDGREEEIRRRGPANIREQLKYLHAAAEEKADILVIECMALQPEYQRVSARNMLRNDIGVITNARLDHMDVMGETRGEILDCLMEMLPEGGSIFTAEQDFRERMSERAKALGSSICFTSPEDLEGVPGAAGIDFSENVALALAVCRSLGVSDEAAVRGFAAFRPDPFALAVYHAGSLTFVNALSANDVTSTKMIWERTRGGEGERLILLLNNREDRPARAADMARLAGELQPAEIWLLGESLPALARLCRKKCPGAEIRVFTNADEIPLSAETPTLILAAGNIKNEGIRLAERAERELRKEGAADVH